MAVKKGLGRGLDSIFFDNMEENTSKSVTTLRISEVQPRKNQPRKNFDSAALSELADSIAAHGLLQPILVRRTPIGLYEIIAGERRWRASKLAGLTEVPVIITEADDKKTAELALIENIQREDLNSYEEAQAYRALIDEFGLTQDALASAMGKSRVAITNALRLLDLPKPVVDLLIEGQIKEGHARALLGLNDKQSIPSVAQIVANNELSVRATEEFVRKHNSYKEKEEPPKEDVIKVSVKDVDYARLLEKKIEKVLGRRARIIEGKRTKKLELEYTDNNDLEKLLSALCGKEIFEDTL